MILNFEMDLSWGSGQFCIVSKGSFNATCGLFNLVEVLKIFREWVEDISIKPPIINQDLEWLTQWFQNNCNGRWERFRKIWIRINDKTDWPLSTSIEWRISINLDDTLCEDRKFEELIKRESKDNWLHCFKQMGIFEATCGPLNVPEVLEIFHNWVENIRVS